MKNIGTEGTPIVTAILWLTAIQMTASAVTFVGWRVTGKIIWIDLFFKYEGSLFFVIFAAVELWLAWTAYRQFSPGEPMRAAWLLITISSFYRFTGFMLSQVLSIESCLNPIFLASGAVSAPLASSLRNFGLLVSGPLHMAVLAWGLFLILRILNRIGILQRLRTFDFVLVAGVAAFTLRQAYEIIIWLSTTPPPYGTHKVLGWASDPLLSILLFEAILIRRSAAETGWGLLAKSWGAFAAGIFLTSLGDIGLWASAHGYLPWPHSSVTWYVWFLASAAFALGPAYQVEACRRASHQTEANGLSRPL